MLGETGFCNLSQFGQPTPHRPSPLGSPDWVDLPASACCRCPAPVFVSNSADGSNVFPCHLQHGPRPPSFSAKSQWHGMAQFPLHSSCSRATALAAIPWEKPWQELAALPGPCSSTLPSTLCSPTVAYTGSREQPERWFQVWVKIFLLSEFWDAIGDLQVVWRLFERQTYEIYIDIWASVKHCVALYKRCRINVLVLLEGLYKRC